MLYLFATFDLRDNPAPALPTGFRAGRELLGLIGSGGGCSDNAPFVGNGGKGCGFGPALGCESDCSGRGTL